MLPTAPLLLATIIEDGAVSARSGLWVRGVEKIKFSSETIPPR